MKTLEDYMKLNYRLEFEPDEDEGGYVAYFPELPGCITIGAPPAAAAAPAADAPRPPLAAALEPEMEIPLPEKKDKYSGQFKLRVPKALHKLLSQHAKQEGINMNQYCVYLLTRNDALNAK